jgi:hypothetical protein
MPPKAYEAVSALAVNDDGLTAIAGRTEPGNDKGSTAIKDRQNRLIFSGLSDTPSKEIPISNIKLTVRSFWKFISKNWKFSFEEQRTSNGVSISLRTTARLIDKRPGKTIRKAGKFFNERKYKSL